MNSLPAIIKAIFTHYIYVYLCIYICICKYIYIYAPSRTASYMLLACCIATDICSRLRGKVYCWYVVYDNENSKMQNIASRFFFARYQSDHMFWIIREIMWISSDYVQRRYWSARSCVEIFNHREFWNFYVIDHQRSHKMFISLRFEHAIVNMYNRISFMRTSKSPEFAFTYAIGNTRLDSNAPVCRDNMHPQQKSWVTLDLCLHGDTETRDITWLHHKRYLTRTHTHAHLHRTCSCRFNSCDRTVYACSHELACCVWLYQKALLERVARWADRYGGVICGEKKRALIGG